MPELFPGSFQGDVLPIYLAIRTLAGDLVPQPPNNPTIEIVYIDADSHVRKVSVVNTPMREIEPGRYFFVWRIPAHEPTIVHSAIMKAVLDSEQLVATDQSFVITGQIENPEFSININIVEKPGICYPEVMPQGPYCRGKRVLPLSHGTEADIGLDDYAIEGVFRFGEFPNQVVDRRVSGRFSIDVGVGRTGSGYVSSDTPGGGSEQRPGNPATNTRYTKRSRYRY